MSTAASVPAPSTPAAPATPAKPAASGRLMSLDALRGFDMFWIIGGGSLFIQLDAIVHPGQTKQVGWLGTLAQQLTHKQWEGFAFEDLIFPLFVFIMGVSVVFSVTKEIQQHGVWGAHKRIFRRAALLFAFGIFATGGLSKAWPEVQLSGVLFRLAWCYLFTALAFCYLKPRGLIALTLLLLGGYWALMTYVPVPKIKVEKDVLAARAKELGIQSKEMDLRTVGEVLDATTERVTGSFEKGLNLCNYLDARYLPGRKNDGHYSNEGILSTMTAVASCLLGALACLWLRAARFGSAAKIVGLVLTGVAFVALGFWWDAQFPIIKKVWTSSYVLVAGGYSALLLALFYLVVDVWQLRLWCVPFVWIGTNSITIYVLRQVLPWSDISQRLVGGNIANWLNAYVGKGTSTLATYIATFTLIILLARFLYRRNIFLRL